MQEAVRRICASCSTVSAEALRRLRGCERTRSRRGQIALVLLASVLALVALSSRRPPVLAERLPSLESVLQNYSHAAADPAASDLKQVVISGNLSGGGLMGTFTTWRQNDRERTDERLGPSHEKTLRNGTRYWYEDTNGYARELTGSLARRERTERFIDTGEFATRPDRCVLRGRSVVRDRATYVIDVAAEGGETQTLYVDALTWLPARVAFDDDDGRSTVDYSDWRSVAGHRFPFVSIASNGDRAYDTTRTTTALDTATALDAATFAPFVSRAIDMSGAETVKLDLRDGHLFAPVSIAGHTYAFLVDTGAQGILIDRRVVTQLGLATSGTLQASGATRTGGLQLAEVPELRVGARGRLGHLVVTTIDLAASSAGTFRADGILGYPFFAAATVRLDSAARTMTFAPPGALALEGESLALDVDRGLPEAILSLNGTLSAPFVVDTGNAAELLLYAPFVKRHGGVVPFSPGKQTTYGIGGAATSYRSSLDRLDIGTIALYHVETAVMLATRGAFADRFDAGDVGLGILRNLIVTFDEAHALMYVERGADFDDGRTRN